MNYWDRYRDKRIVYHARLRATRVGASGSFTITQWRDLCARHDHACAICKARVPLTADHIIPFAQGGTNSIENIQPLCKSCNSRKGDSLPTDIKGEESAQSLTDRLKRYTSHARHRLIIDVGKARMLSILARQNDVSVDHFVERLIEQAWHDAVRKESSV